MNAYDGQVDDFGGDWEGFAADAEVFMFDGRVDPEIPFGVHKVVKKDELTLRGIEDLTNSDRERLLSIIDWLQPEEKRQVMNAYYPPRDTSSSVLQ